MSRGAFLILPLFLITLLGCGGGGSNATPRGTNVSISIIPASATVPVGKSTFFSANVVGSTNTNVTWSVNGVTGGNATVGTVSLGNYTSPSSVPTPVTVQVTATSAADTTKSASATVAIALAISPPNAQLNVGTPQSFTAAGIGSAPLNWGVNGIQGGNATFGVIDSSGNYTAPAAIPDPPTVTVSATSQSDPTQTGVAPCTIQAGGVGVNEASQLAPIKLGTTGGSNLDTSAGFCCSGTLGSLLTRGGVQYILSNNHVLARSDKGKAGDPIGQPGLVDNGCNPGTIVANLSQWVNLEANKSGSVFLAPADAAMAQVVAGQVDPTGSILQLGAVVGGLAQPAPPASSTVAPAIGMTVAKSGRTTGLTCSTIAATDLTVQVDYSPSCGSNATAFTAQYASQIDIVSTTFSNSGDSGSLIVSTQTAEPVGLLYAGSPTDTVANPVSDVLTALADSKGVQPTFVGGATHTVGACAGSSSAAAAQRAATATTISDTEMTRAKAIKQKYVDSLMSDPAVFGVGIGAGDAPGTTAIMVLVEEGKTPRSIPAQLDGMKTRVRYTKRFRAFDSCSQAKAQSLLPLL